MSKCFSFGWILCALSLLLGACHSRHDDLEPKISHAIQERYLKQLPSPFPPLSPEERAQDWGKEMLIGQSFARELDLYQALTAFKRAAILVPENSERKLEIEYEILLCYYYGKKLKDVVYTFENSPLRGIDDKFPACRDLLIILYETYEQTNEPYKAQQMLQTLHQLYPETAENLNISTALIHGNIQTVEKLSKEYPDRPYLGTLIDHYNAQKKSPSTAQALNAFIPGAGYFYLGQTQSGFTALLLNGLFIAAATHFFVEGHIAAGAIFTSFEAGWYFGGILGAGLETKLYNERVYERAATPIMNQERLFPVLMLQYAF